MYSLSAYVLSTHCVPDTVIGAGLPTVKRAGKIPELKEQWYRECWDDNTYYGEKSNREGR